jgi:hypothetical protein
MRQVTLALVCAVAGSLAGPALATFETETVCEGLMAFFNDDGSSERYELLMVLDQYGYALTSTNQGTNEVTVDVGSCTAYADKGCRHDVVVDGEKTGDYYTFRLRAMTATSYAYEETWADGFSGRTVLECKQ